jgi:6-phosphogluconolactonase/glucosamine-6-phosphate isomerase/deaminase
MNTHVDAHPASDLVRDTAMRAATLFAQAAMSTLAIRVSFHAALCGGPVLRAMLDALAGLPASRRIDWPHVHLYAVDDSWDEATVARLAASPAAPRNVQRPRVADVARHEAARRYEQRLAACFALPAGDLPVFDFVLLAAGTDGRISGYGCDTGAAANVTRLVVAHDRGLPRVALSLPVIDAARLVALAGETPCVRLLNPRGELHLLSASTARSSGTLTPPTARAMRSAFDPT